MLFATPADRTSPAGTCPSARAGHLSADGHTDVAHLPSQCLTPARGAGLAADGSRSTERTRAGASSSGKPTAWITQLPFPRTDVV